MQHDWQYLNYTSWTSPKVYTYRNPCGIKGQNGQTYTGPLTGITDPQSGVKYCDVNGNIEPALQYQQAGSIYQKPSDILLEYNTDTMKYTAYELLHDAAKPAVPSAAGNPEWFAQSFARVARSDIGGTSNRVLQDQVVDNGYFACTAQYGEVGADGIHLALGYSYLVYKQQAISLPSCTGAMPTGWQRIG
jgi:hypothetical protein